MNTLFCWLLNCCGFVSASYQSFKLLRNSSKPSYAPSPPSTRHGEGAAVAERRALLQLWGTLACTTLWERYMEVFVSWLPLYHVLKFVVVLLVLTHAGTAAFAFDSAVHPAMRWQQQLIAARLLPSLSTAASRCGRGLERWLFRYAADADGTLRASAAGGDDGSGGASAELLGELAADLSRRLQKVREEKKRRLRAK